MKFISKQSGFSAVELLITLFIAAAFLLSGYQLFALAIKDGGDARMQSRANNVANDYIQQYKTTVGATCSASSVTPVSNSNSISGLSAVTITVAFLCPFNTTTPLYNSPVTKVQVSVTYGSPAITIKNATYATQ